MVDAKTKLLISVSSKPGTLGAQVYNALKKLRCTKNRAKKTGQKKQGAYTLDSK